MICVCASQSVVSDSLQPKNTSMGCHSFSRDLPDPGIEPMSLMSLMSPAVHAESLPLSHWGSPQSCQRNWFSEDASLSLPRDTIRLPSYILTWKKDS